MKGGNSIVEFEINCVELRTKRLLTEGDNGKSMSRNLLAEKTGVDVNTIRRLELEPDFNSGLLTVAKIANYFNVSLDSLIIKK